MKRLVLLIVLTLLSQTANAVLEGRHLHIGADLQSIELHFDGMGHDHGRGDHAGDEHAHSEGETCLHHHCHAGHLAITISPTTVTPLAQQQQFLYLRSSPQPEPAELLRPPIA